MSDGDAWLIAGCGLSFLLAGVFSSLESAFTRVSRFEVEELVRAGRRGAAALQRLLDDAPRHLNLLFFLRTATELLAVVCASVVCVDAFGANWRAVLLAAGGGTVIGYLVTGVLARLVGRQHPGQVARRAASSTLLLGRALAPVSGLLVVLAGALTLGRGTREGPFSNEAELRDLVDLAEERRVIESDERRMIHSVFELGDTLVREVMVPRTDMVFIERTKSVRQALSLALRSGFSRVPVVGENEDDVVGVVYLKDLARHQHQGRDPNEPVRGVMRPASYVPDSKPAAELLREMQRRQIHLAVVIDEYGGTAGIVTIEDILEEIVGEIADEYDRELPRVEQVDQDTVRVTARLPVEDVEAMYGVSLDHEDVETVGGLLAATLGRVPIPGARVELQGLTFTAESAKGRRNRIGTVLIHRPNGVSPAAALPQPADA